VLRFVLTRLSLVIPTFLGVTFLAFLLIHLVPGDPIETMAGERGIDPVRHAALMKEYGLDQPWAVQYGIYLLHLLKGDLGKSMITHEPVIREFATLFPATLELSLCAVLFAIFLGLPFGMIAAIKRNTIFDHGIMSISLAGYSMPIFWWGLLLILLFSGELGWTPVSGRVSALYFIEPTTGFLLIDSLLSDDSGAFRSTVAHLILPTIVLGTVPLAIIARMTRSSMLEVLGEDYIRTARAKGVFEKVIVSRHALRNALLPAITVIGLEFAFLIGGLVVTEQVFNLNGIGKLFVQSVTRHDFTLIQGMVMLFALFYVLVNLAVDLLYAALDPRIRLSGGAAK